MSSLVDLTAVELATRVGAGEFSAREVVEAHITRIAAVNPRLNALVVPLFDEVRSTATAADLAHGRGESLGPLHGVPVTVKEQFLVAGTPSTYGLESLQGHRARADGPLVRRLRKAGALILGKTNVSQALIYIEADNPVYGRTRNPWDLARSPGGSSGGEAALIAAGGSPLGLGSDMGGSIREPAHFCGICGLKPTSRRLTNLDNRDGLYPLGLLDGIVPQTGPLARSVGDLSLAMSVLAAPGQERFDASVPPVPWRDPASVAVAGLRVAAYTDDGYFGASPAIRRVVQEAAAALRAAGATVEPWAPPEVAEAMRVYFGIFGADGAAALRRAARPHPPVAQLRNIIRLGGIPRPLRLPAAALARLSGQCRLSRLVRQFGERTAGEYWRLLEDRDRYALRFSRAFAAGGFDALVCPPTSLPALLHGSTVALADFDSHAKLFNLLGWPAGTVPAGRVRPGEETDRPRSRDPVERMAARVEAGSAGLPVGVQVAARPWREDAVLAVMSALEKHFAAQPDYPAARATALLSTG